MSIFSHFQQRFESTRQEELTLQEYLELCKQDKSAYASAAERLLLAIGEPELLDTSNNSRLSRIFSNKVIRRYPAFADFPGMEECIEQIVSYFRHAAQGLLDGRAIASEADRRLTIQGQRDDGNLVVEAEASKETRHGLRHRSLFAPCHGQLIEDDDDLPRGFGRGGHGPRAEHACAIASLGDGTRSTCDEPHGIHSSNRSAHRHRKVGRCQIVHGPAGPIDYADVYRDEASGRGRLSGQRAGEPCDEGEECEMTDETHGVGAGTAPGRGPGRSLSPQGVLQ